MHKLFMHEPWVVASTWYHTYLNMGRPLSLGLQLLLGGSHAFTDSLFFLLYYDVCL